MSRVARSPDGRQGPRGDPSTSPDGSALKRVAASPVARPAAALFVLGVLAGGCTPFDERFPAAPRPAPHQVDVDSLKHALGRSEMDAAVRRYFGGAYVKDLVDLVVYIPASADRPIRSELIWNGDPRRGLSGQRYVWLLAFTEEGRPIEAHVTSLDYQEDKLLRSALTTITGLLGRSVAPAERPSVAQDSTYEVSLTRLHSPGDPSRLFVGMTRIRLAQKTMNRVSIRHPSGLPLGQGESFHHNFPNGERSVFGFSIAGGVTVDSGSQRPRSDGTIDPAGEEFDPLILVHWDLCRSAGVMRCASHPPWSSSFVGLAAGSNLGDGALFDSQVFGLMFGRLYNDVGLLVGANHMKERRFRKEDGEPAVEVDPERAWRLLLAATYAF